MKKVMIPSLDMKKSVSVKVDSDLTLLLSSGVYEIKKMEPRRRLRPIVIICLFLTIAGIIGFGYFCPDQVCALSRREVITNQELITGFEHDNLGKPVQQNLLANPGLSYEEVLNDDFQFDMNAHDVMVFLHIQKTGGTSFGKHLVRDLDLKQVPGGHGVQNRFCRSDSESRHPSLSFAAKTSKIGYNLEFWQPKTFLGPRDPEYHSCM
ncbi:conserved hypothetical protein [Culex quinquefasciatus]|uniref:Heparan-sulfate 6-O-sulfotransferase n=1 Tax=Culex quinquefasciatus TaxID=7176 RepID=B0WY40_CULQU|nr:conserved hypothetical protein [Culex quinquefasciatus]|eukprot:XP_001862312.1 conserved hypothetical protein [Culex quinquefasciatus]